MIAGNPLTALNEPNSLVIDQTTAKKYFNSTDVVGKTLYVDNSVTCKITGVIRDVPSQSHFHFSFIPPMHDTYHDDQGDWLSNNYASYVLVRPGVTQTSLQNKVNATIICPRRPANHSNCIDNGEFPGDKSSTCKSCKKFENRVVQFESLNTFF